MIDYNKMIEQWRSSVKGYCETHKIPNMELKNLRQGDVYNYDLYVAYRDTEKAIKVYQKTPSSPVYAGELLECMKQWYALVTDNRMFKMSMRFAPNSRLIDIFARVNERIK